MSRTGHADSATVWVVNWCCVWTGSMQRFSNTASCVDFPPWAIQKIQEKRFITDHLTIAEFFAMWDDSPQVKDAKSSLGVAKRLVQKGHVLHHGNTVFLEGDKLAAIVEKSLPWSDATIQNRLAVLRREIAPLENEKLRLQEIAYLRAKCILLAGLAALVVQFATMFHLTYAVYSWSETEPIAYFLRYAITIGAYMYFLKSNRMCGHADVYSWLKNQKLMDLYQKNGFDLGKYGRLSKEIERWERYARSSKN